MSNKRLLTAAIAVTASISSFSMANASMITTQKDAYQTGQTNIVKVHDRYRRHSHNDSYTRKSVDQIKFKLEKRGYKKIKVLDNRSPIYLFKVCRDGVKYKFAIRDNGSIKRRTKTGYCSRKHYRAHDSYDRRDRGYREDRYHDRGISRSRILRILGNHGYGRAYFVDSHPPVYKLNACRGGTRYKVSVNNYGSIVNSQRIGYCSTGSRYIDYWKSPRRFR